MQRAAAVFHSKLCVPQNMACFFSRFTLPLLKGLWYRRVMALLDIQKNYMRIELDLASRDFCLAQMQGAPCPLLLSAV